MKIDVLFVCVHNSGRSKIAEYIFNFLAKEYNKPIYAYSAGTEPSEKVNKRVVNIMNKKGYDFLFVKPRKLTNELIIRADNVITMGCGIDSKSCPSIYGKKIIDWGLDDPYDMTENQIEELIVNSDTLRTYKISKSENKSKKDNFTVERKYATINNGELMLIQDYVFNKVLININELKK